MASLTPRFAPAAFGLGSEDTPSGEGRAPSPVRGKSPGYLVNAVTGKP